MAAAPRRPPTRGVATPRRPPVPADVPPALTRPILPTLTPVDDHRIGIGWDIHRLVTGRRLVLGGVEVPAPAGFDTHSDGDVLSHAVVDALAGAIADGDLGTHFPEDDPEADEARSLDFVVAFAARVRERGLRGRLARQLRRPRDRAAAAARRRDAGQPGRRARRRRSTASRSRPARPTASVRRVAARRPARRSACCCARPPDRPPERTRGRPTPPGVGPGWQTAAVTQSTGADGRTSLTRVEAEARAAALRVDGVEVDARPDRPAACRPSARGPSCASPAAWTSTFVDFAGAELVSAVLNGERARPHDLAARPDPAHRPARATTCSRSRA